MNKLYIKLKNVPFGYKNSKELFENLIKPRFAKLLNSKSYDDYYDFIFSVGVLKDWLRNEYPNKYYTNESWFWNKKFLSIFHTIYDNVKHHMLIESQNRNKPYDYFIIEVNESLFPTNENGETISDDSFSFDESGVWVDDKIQGEPGKSLFYCIIQDKMGNQEMYYVYHICKEVYIFYEELFKNVHFV